MFFFYYYLFILNFFAISFETQKKYLLEKFLYMSFKNEMPFGLTQKHS